MQLIKNKADWAEYASVQESRTYPHESKHINAPTKFPCLVITNLRSSNGGFDLIHNCIYKEDAKLLLKIK